MSDTAATAAFVSAGVALLVGVLNPVLSSRKADQRLREQLAQERWLKIRDERVELIYTVARALTSAQRATDEVVALWSQGVPWDAEERIAASDTQWDRVEDLRQARARLAIRYAPKTPIFKAFDEAQVAQNEFRHLLEEYEAGKRLSDVEYEELRATAVKARRAWLDEARVLLEPDSVD
jgi:hypothetical protein